MPIYKDYNNHEINDIIDDACEIRWFKSNISFQSIYKIGSYRRRINYYNV